MNQSRRQILKFIAAAPLTLTFGLAGEALLRFAKPSMRPGGVFDPADMPTSIQTPVYTLADFQEPWTCIPFMFHMKVTEFNPEQQELRTIPGYVIRTQTNDIVAYSRICPLRGCGYLQFIPDLSKYNCGCVPASERCCCAVSNPVLMCPCDGSIYDLTRDGKVLRGSKPLHKFSLDRQGDIIAVIDVENHAIL